MQVTKAPIAPIIIIEANPILKSHFRFYYRHRKEVEKSERESVMEYTLPEKNEQIFASKYQTVLPSKEELKLIITERNSQR